MHSTSVISPPSAAIYVQNYGLKFYPVTHDFNIACSPGTVDTTTKCTTHPAIAMIYPSRIAAACSPPSRIHPTHQSLSKQQTFSCVQTTVPATNCCSYWHSGWSVVLVYPTVLQHTLSTSPSLTTTVISCEPTRAEWFYTLSDSVVNSHSPLPIWRHQVLYFLQHILAGTARRASTGWSFRYLLVWIECVT